MMKARICDLGGCQSPCRASIAAVLMFLAATLSDRGVVAQGLSPSAPPAQLAEAIARTMNATTPSANSVVSQQFVSHDNVVESRTIFTDANAFANAAAHRNSTQMQLTRYMCKADRRAYLRRGVVFHDIFVGPGATKPFDFVIDERVCASLASPIQADPETLTRMARDIAQQLTTVLSSAQRTSASHFKEAVSQGGTVSIVYIVDVPAFVDYFKIRGFEVRGKTQGAFCNKFGDAIRQGVRVQVVYRLEDGTPILEIPVDNSVC